MPDRADVPTGTNLPPSEEALANAGRALRLGRTALADACAGELERAAPAAWAAWSDRQKALCRSDFAYHLDYLAEALSYSAPELFAEYALWLRRLFAGLRLPPESFGLTWDCLRTVLDQRLGDGQKAAALSYLARAAETPPAAPAREDKPYAREAERFLGHLRSGRRREANAYVLELADGDVPLDALFVDVVQESLRELGRLWMDGTISVAEEHFCTAAAQTALAQLYPRIFAGPRNGLRVVAACAGDELHEVGLRMVADLLELAGWDSVFLGANTPARAVLQALESSETRLLCLSATIASHVPLIEETIGLVRSRHGRDRIAIMVGGYPFLQSPGLWRKLGADACAPDARSAVLAAAELAGPQAGRTR